MVLPDIASIGLIIGFGMCYLVHKSGYTDYSALLLFVITFAGKPLAMLNPQVFIFWNVLIWVSIIFLLTQIPTFLKRVSSGNSA